MAEILACRLCLSTNVRLLRMYDYRLNIAYENLTGIEMTVSDKLQHACSFCSALLVKSSTFQQMCRNSHNLLKLASADNRLVTTDIIKQIQVGQPNPRLKIQHNEATTVISNDKITETTNVHNEDITVKNEDVEWNDWDFNCDIKSASSDEEPLSTLVSKKSDIKSENDICDVKPNKSRRKHTKNGKSTLIADVVVKSEKVNLSNHNLNNDNLNNDENLDNDSNFNDDDYSKNDSSNVEKEKYLEMEVILISKEEQIKEIQSRKTSMNYKNSFYKCEKCFKGFISVATYNNHMIRHDPSTGAFECDVCFARWRTAGLMRAHAASAHERRFVCARCQFVCRSRHRAGEHARWHGGHKFTCEHCDAVFNKSTSHLTHLRLHHPSEHSCELCGESFISANGLKLHKKKAHRNEESQTSCCDVCNTQFRTPEAYKRHKSPDGCDPSASTCARCGERCRGEAALAAHRGGRCGGERVRCDPCGRSFAHARSYAAHAQLKHAGRAPPPRAALHVCEVCGKSSNSKASLRIHQRTHTGERPYQCSECPKTFSVLQRLQIHLRTHTGERPYKCNHCPKAFKHKAALNRHDRVHTGAKPYACRHCGKAFTQSNSLKLHIRTVHLHIPSPYRRRPAA